MTRRKGTTGEPGYCYGKGLGRVRPPKVPLPRGPNASHKGLNTSNKVLAYVLLEKP